MFETRLEIVPLLKFELFEVIVALFLISFLSCGYRAIGKNLLPFVMTGCTLVSFGFDILYSVHSYFLYFLCLLMFYFVIV